MISAPCRSAADFLRRNPGTPVPPTRDGCGLSPGLQDGGRLGIQWYSSRLAILGDGAADSDPLGIEIDIFPLELQDLAAA
jgi:hypothetical protein